MQHVLGGKVEKADVGEYGKSHLIVSKQESKLMKDVGGRVDLLDESF